MWLPKEICSRKVISAALGFEASFLAEDGCNEYGAQNGCILVQNLTQRILVCEDTALDNRGHRLGKNARRLPRMQASEFLMYIRQHSSTHSHDLGNTSPGTLSL